MRMHAYVHVHRPAQAQARRCRGGGHPQQAPPRSTRRGGRGETRRHSRGSVPPPTREPIPAQTRPQPLSFAAAVPSARRSGGMPRLVVLPTNPPPAGIPYRAPQSRAARRLPAECAGQASRASTQAATAQRLPARPQNILGDAERAKTSRRRRRGQNISAIPTGPKHLGDADRAKTSRRSR